jgi:hypothetical protein
LSKGRKERAMNEADPTSASSEAQQSTIIDRGEGHCSHADGWNWSIAASILRMRVLFAESLSRKKNKRMNYNINKEEMETLRKNGGNKYMIEYNHEMR